jgi:hypothetical protein
MSSLNQADRFRLIALASAARRGFEAGFIHLVQIRLDVDHFAYCAVARTKPRTKLRPETVNCGFANLAEAADSTGLPK